MKASHLLLIALLSCTTLAAQTTWHEIESTTDVKLNCIDFVDNQIGYIGGYETLLKTTNGGLSWTAVQVDSITPINLGPWEIHDIHFFTESHGRIMLSEWAGMHETFDGGVNWSPIGAAHAGFCRFGGLYFFDENNGFAGGGGCFEGALIDKLSAGVWETTNYPQDFGSGDLVVNFDFLTSNVGLACTNRDRLFSTIDGGLNWDTVTHTGVDVNFTDIAFLNTDTAYATYSKDGGFGVMISTDGGQSFDDDWETATFFYPSMRAVHINGSGAPFIGGIEGNSNEQGVIFNKSTNFWSYDAVDYPINDIDSYGDSIVFCVGDSGAIYVNTNPVLLSLDELNSQIDFHLFPNPAAEFVQVSLNQAWGPLNRIRIFDAQGKEAKVITKSSNYGVSISIDHLSFGVYFIEIVMTKGRNVKRFVKEKCD